MLIQTKLRSQITLRPDLENTLKGKSNINEIWQSVNDYYFQKFADATIDSMEIKKLKREYKKWNRQLWWSEHFTDHSGNVLKTHMKLELQEYQNSLREIGHDNNSRHQTSAFSHLGPNNVTFSLINGEGIGRVDRIAFQPNDPLSIYAGTPHGGLFKTNNGGSSWSSVSKYLAPLGVSGIAISGSNPNTIYILSGDGDTSDNGLPNTYLYRSESTGVYKTIDGGDNWFKTNSFPNITEGEYRGRNLIIHPNNNNILYAATSEGLFKTDNGGNTWNSVINNINIWDVKFKSNNPQEVYAVGDNSFWRSTNGGSTFSEINVSNLNNAQRISMAVTPANPSLIMLFAGDNNSLNGVYKSTDSGTSFQMTYGLGGGSNDDLFFNYCDLNVENYQGLYNNCIAISPTNSNRVLVGGLVVWASDDGGNTWYQETCYWAGSSILGEYMHPDQHTLMYHPNGTLYVGNDGGVSISYDDGDDWEFKSNGISATQFYRFEAANDEGDIWGGAQDNGVLEQEDGTEYAIYAGGDGFDMITDHPSNAANGESDDVYYTVNEKIYKDCAGLSDCNISVSNNEDFFGNLAMNPMNEDELFVGYRNSVYRTLDAGVGWTSLGNMPGNWCLSTCPSNENRIYAAGANSNHSGGIRRWDSGTWTDLTGNLINTGYSSSLKITDIEVYISGSNSVYISCAGFEEGYKVFYTDNAGSTWQNISYNLPNIPVFSLERDNLTGVLYAGTSYGVYVKRQGINFWEPFSNGLPPVPVTDMQIVLDVSGWKIWVSTYGRGLWEADIYEENCPTTINLSGNVKGKIYRDSDETITSTQVVSFQPGSHLIYNTGDFILLTPGFHAQKGSKFRAELSGCGNAVNEE